MIHAEPNESASITISPVLTRWLREHDNVRRLLMLIETLLEGVRGGDETELALLQDAVTYLNEYMDRFHHPMEDAALRRLGATRAGETALPNAVAFAAGHSAIAESGTALLDDIVAAEADIPISRDALVASGRAYCSELRQHMSAEEASLFPELAQALSDREWEEILREIDPPDDPLFGAHVGDGYRALLISLKSRAGCDCSLE